MLPKYLLISAAFVRVIYRRLGVFDYHAFYVIYQLFEGNIYFL